MATTTIAVQVLAPLRYRKLLSRYQYHNTDNIYEGKIPVKNTNQISEQAVQKQADRTGQKHSIEYSTRRRLHFFAYKYCIVNFLVFLCLPRLIPAFLFYFYYFIILFFQKKKKKGKKRKRKEKRKKENDVHCYVSERFSRDAKKSSRSNFLCKGQEEKGT